MVSVGSHPGARFAVRAACQRRRRPSQTDPEVVNTLGLKDGGDPVKFLDGREQLSPADLDAKAAGNCSWPSYSSVVLDCEQPKVSRYNADTTGIDCCRSEGKVLILATMHDTYEIPSESQVVWVACKDRVRAAGSTLQGVSMRAVPAARSGSTLQ